MINKYISLWLLGVTFWILPISTLAALDTQLKLVGGKIGTDAPKDFSTFIGGLINVFLSVLGIIFVVLVVYAGYLWMTAGGETTKVDKAKKLLGQAVIGLVLIVGAYAISAFVIDKLSGAITTAQPGGTAKQLNLE